MKIVGTAIIMDEENNILIGQRPEGKDLANYWEFPGGKLEEGENIKQCIVREIQEELNVTCEVGDFLMDVVKQYSHGEFRLSVYFATIKDVEHLKVNVHQQVRWVKAKDLKQYQFPEADVEIIEHLVNKF